MTTDPNPYRQQLERLPAYHRFDPRVPGFLAEVSLDRVETVIASVHVNHGPRQVGHLTITNQRLRFFRRLLFRGHDFWPLTTTMVVDHAFPPVITLADGSLFQSRGVRPGPIKEFVALHQVMVEAMIWDQQHSQPAPVPVVVAGSDVTLAKELASLDDFRQQGMLSDAEFAAAKRRLLGLSA